MSNYLTTEPWQMNELQFARLIAEAEAAGVFAKDGRFNDMCESMDLVQDQIAELIDRAQEVWDMAKYVVGDAEKQKYLTDLLEKSRGMYETDDVEIDGPLFPFHLSEGDDGTWVKGWLFVPKEMLPGYVDDHVCDDDCRSYGCNSERPTGPAYE